MVDPYTSTISIIMKKYSIIEGDTQELCTHGCGCLAKYKSPTGIPTCDSHRNKCPSIRAKNSSSLQLSYKEHKRKSGKEVYEQLPPETKDRMAWSRGKTALDDSNVAKFVSTRKKNYAAGKFALNLQGFAKHDELRWKRTKFSRKDSFGANVVLESKNEIEFAKLLDESNIKWSRPQFKSLSNGKRYTPDFYLPDYNVYCDPKSIFYIIHFKSKQLEKIKLFEEEYNTKVMIFWDTDKSKWKQMLSDLKW